MNELSQKIAAWWMQLAAREQKMLRRGAVLLLIVIMYQGVWSPYTDAVNNMRQRIISGQKTLVWMQAADQEIRHAQVQTTATAKPVSPVMLLSVVQDKLDQAGLSPALSELKQYTHDAIEMHFQKVEFDAFMRLLLSVVKEQRVIVTQLSVTAESAPGVVKVDVVLKMV